MFGSPEREKEAYCYFKDGVRKIDFVIVYEQNRTQLQMKEIEIYFTNLNAKGIEMEFEEGIKYTNLVFVKLHASEKILLDVANAQNVILTFEKDRTIPNYKRRFLAFKNFLMHRPNPQNPLYQRISNGARGIPTTSITTAERILLINYLLTRTEFGDGIGEHGLSKLISKKTFQTAYPLHDGPWQWSETGFLTDRQMLFRFWADPRCWYQAQPIHLIYRYYGPEAGFRFAWLGYYNKMLIPISVIGVLTFLFSLITLPGCLSLREICESNIIMCPTCMWDRCGFRPLRNSCNLAHLTYLFDNWVSIIFAVVISIWATIFVEFWQRQESILLFKWNLLGKESDIEIRAAYDEATLHRRVSKATGAIEAYVPASTEIIKYTISSVACILMLVVIIINLMGCILLAQVTRNFLLTSNNKFLQYNVSLLSMTTATVVNVLFIRICDPLFTKLALRLTKMENHRTTLQYYNAYIIKRFLLNFCNNYFNIFYLALVKGKFFTHPGDLKQYTRFLGIQADVCHPSGCLSRITIYLAFMVLMKTTTLKGFKYGVPIFKRCIRRAKARALNKSVSVELQLPQWEEEYKLIPMGEFHFVGAMMDRILQYGVVLFFISALPLLPIIALVANLLELRLTAFNLVKNTRRPVPRRLSGLGAWNGIIAATTYFSVFFNGLMIAFATEFVPREIYRYEHGTLKGYLNSTLAEFAVADFEEPVRSRLQNSSNITICYYKAYRHKPTESNKYEENDLYFYHLGMAFLIIIIFEHIVLILTGVLAYTIPDIPFIIKEFLAYEEQQIRQAKLKNMKAKF